MVLKSYLTQNLFLKYLSISLRWGRWPEILAHSHFRRGWRESDVEDCARVIVSISITFVTKLFFWGGGDAGLTSERPLIQNVGYPNKISCEISNFILRIFLEQVIVIVFTG
jgi:hypothetical protein